MIVKSKEEAIMEHNKLVIEIKSRIGHILREYEYLDKNVLARELHELSYIADFYVEERRRIRNKGVTK